MRAVRIKSLSLNNSQKLIRGLWLFYFMAFSPVLFSQNISTCGSTGGVNLVGSMQGYSQPINCSANYSVLNYRKISTTVVNPSDGRGQWKTTCNVQSSGGDFAPSNMSGGSGSGFLLTNGDVCGNTGAWTRKWVFPSNYQGTLDALNATNYYTTGGSDMGMNMGTAGHYTVVLQDAGCVNSSYFIGYTANAPVSLTFGAQVLNGDGSYTIPINTNATPSSGENIFIRYRLTTNDFTTSTFLIQASGSGTAWSATIPFVPTGTTVYYYAFTSTRTLANLNADSESNRSLSALNYLDNAGNNYNYLQSIITGPILVTGTTPVTSVYYNSLTQAAGAFAAINAGTHKGVITVTILNNVSTENGLNPLYQSGYLTLSSYTDITIQPSGARTISGSVNTQMIDFNGCDNVTINGLNSGGNSLIIENTNALASNGTLRLINDATFNTITNCTLKGSSNQSNAAVVFFSSANATSLQGNDNNSISNCIIRESINGDPIFGINSFGTSGGVAPAARWNSNNTINNNQVINVFAPFRAICAAIQLTNGSNTSWSIHNNSMYWTTNKTTTSAVIDYVYGIRITGGNGENFNIHSNYFGGTAALGLGTPMTIANNTFGNKISAIYINSSNSGVTSQINNNTVTNISLNTNSSKATSPYVFSGIMVDQGLVNLSGNLVGSTTNTGNITVTVVTNSSGIVTGIATGGAGTNTNISTNTVCGITVANLASSAIYVNFYGLYLKATPATCTVTSNTIGSTSLLNSILNTSGNTSSTAFHTMGIQLTGTAATISQNTISNLTYTGAAQASSVAGILCNNGTVSNNSIQNLTNSSPSILTQQYASVYGIMLNVTASTSTATENTINNLINSNPAGTGGYRNTGIRVVLNAGFTANITRNRIYDLRVQSTSANNFIHGIELDGNTSHTANVVNNMISLGNGLVNNPKISGLVIENTIGNGLISANYNSIAITGAAAGIAALTNCVFMNLGSSFSFQNNIFYNTRTSATATNNTAYYCPSAAQLANITLSNYNDFYLGSNPNVCEFVGAVGSPYTSLSAWQTNTAKDLNSLNVLPTFVNAASDLHLAMGNCLLYGAGTAIATTIDYDNQTRKNPPDIGADENTGAGLLTWTGATSTNWYTASNWCPPVVPTLTNDVFIPSAPINQPLISGGVATCQNLTISSGAANLDMNGNGLLTLAINAVFTNNGAFNSGPALEEVQFLGAGTISGTAATTFRNLTINGTTTLSTIPTITASLKLNSTSSVTAAPNYGATSALVYNTTGSYNVNNEWTGSATTAGTGVPNDVTIQNTTTLNMPTVLRGMAGNLNISSGTLQMNGTIGADLSIAGNWTRNASTGVFNPNNRAIRFKGSANQTVTVAGGGTESFHILVIDKPVAGTYLLPNATVGNLTDITVNGNMANTVAVLQFINQGSLDLNGRIFRLDGNNSVNYPGHIYVNGPRVIHNSAGINNGSFAILSSANPNQSSWYTRSVWNNSGTGTLTFNQDVLVTLADGRMDWGLDANGVNITTIQGVLQINLGGSVILNSCYYSSSPPSTLRFGNTIDYQVNPGDKTWVFGAIYSGLAGIPWNVEVNNTNTDLTINEVRAVRNNLTITDGRLTLNAGPFNVGGNWTRTNPAGITVPPCAFVPNTFKVVFDKTGATDQIINCTANSSTETFYDLDISPATVNVTLGGTTNVVVTNNLILTSGKFDLNTNQLTLGTTLAPGTLTGGSSASYILAYKAAMNGTFRRYTPSIATDYLFPLGDNSNYTPISITYNAGTTFSSAYTDAQLFDVVHPMIGTATSYITRYWPVTPNGITTPNYDAVYTYADADIVGSEALLFPFKYNPYGWVGSGGSAAAFTQGTGSVNPITNTLTWNNINSFSEFTGLADGTTLPINLLSFNATLKNKDVLLNWITSSEENNDYFTLERSWDAQNFVPINIQKGAGNSTVLKSYYYNDKTPEIYGYNRAYYRLKQTDFNGQFSYSKNQVVVFSKEQENSILTAFPNPFNASFELTIWSEEKTEAQLDLYAADGKIMLSKMIPIENTFNTISLQEASAFSSGFYFVNLRLNSKNYSLKLIKE
jgi:hypothetical protein